MPKTIKDIVVLEHPKEDVASWMPLRAWALKSLPKAGILKTVVGDDYGVGRKEVATAAKTAALVTDIMMRSSWGISLYGHNGALFMGVRSLWASRCTLHGCTLFMGIALYGHNGALFIGVRSLRS